MVLERGVQQGVKNSVFSAVVNCLEKKKLKNAMKRQSVWYHLYTN